MPNNRSDAAMRERLELAKKAGDKQPGTWESRGTFGDAIVWREKTDENDTVTHVVGRIIFETVAAHIAACSPDVVRADLEEIIALRAEVARLKDEIASLEQELKFSDETEYDLIKKLFELKICHKEVICEQADAHKLNFEGESGCLFCWRQWAIRKARKAEIEDE